MGMRFLVLLAMSFSTSAFASGNWNKIDLPENSPLRQFPYEGSIADAIYSSPNLHTQPIQHIGEAAQPDFSNQAKTLASRIFQELGVDLKHNTTEKHGKGFERYYSGPNKNLSAVIYDYASVNERGSKIVTCVAVVRDHQKVHAVFLEGWKSSLKDCSAKLKMLTDSKILYE